MTAGIIHIYAGVTPPEGFLACDGSAVSRSTYSELFSAIGTTFGAGDGSTTFNLPDLSGKVGIGSSQGIALGSTGGSETVTLTEQQIASHAHEFPQHGHANDIAVTTPSLSHSVTQPAFNYTAPNGTGTIRSGSGTTARSGTTTANATLSTTITVANHASAVCTMGGSVADCPAFDTADAGSGVAHNNMQPYITLQFIISTGD